MTIRSLQNHHLKSGSTLADQWNKLPTVQQLHRRCFQWINEFMTTTTTVANPSHHQLRNLGGDDKVRSLFLGLSLSVHAPTPCVSRAQRRRLKRHHHEQVTDLVFLFFLSSKKHETFSLEIIILLPWTNHHFFFSKKKQWERGGQGKEEVRSKRSFINDNPPEYVSPEIL